MQRVRVQSANAKSVNRLYILGIKVCYRDARALIAPRRLFVLPVYGGFQAVFMIKLKSSSIRVSS